MLHEHRLTRNEDADGDDSQGSAQECRQHGGMTKGNTEDEKRRCRNNERSGKSDESQTVGYQQLNEGEEHEAEGRLGIPDLGVRQSSVREAPPHQKKGAFVFVDDIHEEPWEPDRERKDAEAGRDEQLSLHRQTGKGRLRAEGVGSPGERLTAEKAVNELNCRILHRPCIARRSRIIE